MTSSGAANKNKAPNDLSYLDLLEVLSRLGNHPNLVQSMIDNYAPFLLVRSSPAEILTGSQSLK
jgi:hypothetical protein